MKKIWTGMLKWAGIDVGKERDQAQKWSPAALKPNSRWRGIPRFRSRNWFADKRMRRGVERARERAQRGYRLTRILASQLQGIEVRNRFREDQLADRRGT